MSDEKLRAADPRLRLLRWLWISAAVLVVLAVLAQTATLAPREKAFEPRPLWPDFDQVLPDVTALEVISRDEHFTIERYDTFWGVKERAGYPVRGELLRSTLWGLGDMKLIAPKTARADRHQALGLVAPEDGGEATHFRVLAGGSVRLSVQMGIPEGAETLDGALRTYVRYGGEDQTWLGEGRLEAEPSLQEWLDLDILDLDARRIARVVREDGDVSFSVSRPDPETYNFALDALGPGEAMAGPTAANGLGRALIALTPSDVHPASAFDFSTAPSVRFETFDGLAVTLRVAQVAADTWVTIEAEAAASGKSAPDTGGAPLDGDEDRPDIASEVLQLNNRAAGWAFKIPAWKGQQLTITRASLLKQDTDN